MTRNNAEEPLKKILAFDTAMNGCSVSFYDAEKELFVQKKEPMMRGQAEVLVPMIQSVVQQAGHDISDMDLFSVTIGPGAFTGVRIGISTARSLAFAAGKPLGGYTTMEVIAAERAAENKQDESIAVLLETKRKDFYVQIFSGAGQKITAPAALELDDVLSLIEKHKGVLIGDAVKRFREMTTAESLKGWEIEGETYNLPDTNRLSIMARAHEGPYERISPLYLRGADVSKSKKNYRILQE